MGNASSCASRPTTPTTMTTTTTTTMANTVILRPAQRSDIPELTRIANAGNTKSAIHRRMCLHQDEYPLGYRHWRLNIIRQRFVTPDLRTMVAVDSLSGKVLGQASYAVEGPDTALYNKWTSEASSWTQWLEEKCILAEKWWCRYFTDRCIDYNFLSQFIKALDPSGRPPCLHCHLIVVDPDTHSKGVGRLLIDWGKELAVQEDLPLYLESNLEATGFYEKGGFSRMAQDFVVDPDGEAFRVPVYVWEGQEREGRWLEIDHSHEGEGEGEGKRRRWREL